MCHGTLVHGTSSTRGHAKLGAFSSVLDKVLKGLHGSVGACSIFSVSCQVLVGLKTLVLQLVKDVVAALAAAVCFMIRRSGWHSFTLLQECGCRRRLVVSSSFPFHWMRTSTCHGHGLGLNRRSAWSMHPVETPSQSSSTRMTDINCNVLELVPIILYSQWSGVN
jgi:hypothetical protein